MKQVILIATLAISWTGMHLSWLLQCFLSLLHCIIRVCFALVRFSCLHLWISATIASISSFMLGGVISMIMEPKFEHSQFGDQHTWIICRQDFQITYLKWWNKLGVIDPMQIHIHLGSEMLNNVRKRKEYFTESCSVQVARKGTRNFGSFLIEK